MDNCQAIAELLAAEELDSDELLKLVQVRDQLITEYLSSLQNEEKKAYINRELEVNNELLGLTVDLQQGQKKLLLGLVRGKSAVSRYR